MTPAPLKFVSEKVAADLFGSIEENIDRYLEGDFSDLARELGWALETRSVEFDSGFADDLIAESGKEAEIANSMLVFDALKGMTPAVARDERIWVRLCHIEALVYARKRWIGASDPARDVRNHFFASGLPQCRDDNALGRLWWNGHLAQTIDKENPKAVLEQILARANIRLQFVDRANASFRIPLARGLVRLLSSEPWLHSHDRAFEDYIRVLDRNGGGRLFEADTDKEVDEFLKENLPIARAEHDRRHVA